MANPLKVLTDLVVSGSTSTSGSIAVMHGGSITIGGSQVPTVAGVSGSFATPSAVSASFATPSAVSASFATPSAVSASFATPSAVSASFATLTGVSASFATPSAVSASIEAAKYAITGTAVTFASDVTVVGNLTVQGTTTSVDSQIVNIGDKSIALASGSTTLSDANGAGFSVGSGSDGLAQFQYNHTSTAFKSSENLNLATGKAYKVDDSTVLSKTTLGETVVSSSLKTLGTLNSLTVGGISTLSGAVLFKSDTQLGNFLNSGSLNDLTGILNVIYQNLGPPDTSFLLQKTVYSGVRSYSYASKGAGSSVQFLLSGSGVKASNGSQAVTASCPTLLSGSSSGAVMSKLRYASFDVAVKSNGVWSNDLVSVQLTESAQLNNYYWPLVTVDGPALTNGDEIRLIVVNEQTEEFI